MIDAKERETLNSGMKIIWIIWGAMFVSLGIYIIAAHIIADQIKMQSLAPDVFSLLRNVLYVIVLVELALIPFIKKLSLKSPLKLSQASIQQIPGAGNHPAVGKYASVVIISLAIAESIAVYGLLLFILGKDSHGLYLLIAISAMAMILYRPKMDELEKLAVALSEK